MHAGGQAVVGTIQTPGGEGQLKSEDQPHAKQIAYAPQPAMWSADKERVPVPVTRDAERSLPDARRPAAALATEEARRSGSATAASAARAEPGLVLRLRVRSMRQRPASPTATYL